MVGPAPAPAPGPGPAPTTNLTVNQLKALLKTKSLLRTGNKAGLLKRALHFGLIVDAAAIATIADEVAAIVPDVSATAGDDDNVAVTAANIAPAAADGDAVDMETGTSTAEEGATQCIAWIAS